MLSPDRIQELRVKAGIKPQGIASENTAQSRIQSLRKNTDFAGVHKYDVAPKPVTLNERIAKAQTQAKTAQDYAKSNTGFLGVAKNTLKGIGSTLASSEIGLGKTIAKAIDRTPDEYAKNVETVSQTIAKTKKIIDAKEAEGKDVTSLKRFYNSQVDQLKENKQAISQYESELPTTGEVVGQVAGTVLDTATSGLFKSAKSMAGQKATGLFTKQGVKNVAQGAGIGYGYDVSLGLQGARGEDRTGGKAFIPGLGTAIGGGIPAISEGVQSIKNVRNPDYQANKLITKRQKELDKLDTYSTLKKATEKGRERGIDVKKVLADTDVLHGAVDKTGTITTKGEGGAIEQYTKQFIDGNEGIVGEALRKEGKGIAPSIIKQKLKDAVMQSGIEGKALTSALKNIDDELAGYAIKGTEGGSIPLATLHDAKVNKYNNINFFTEGNAKQYDKTIAKALKEIVEKESKDVAVKEINKELSKHFAVIDYLNKLDNKKVAGGKLGKYFAQTVGAMVGSHFGPVGAVAGAEIGGRIKGGAMERSFTGKTGKTLPQAEAITKTRGYIETPPMQLPQSRSNSLGSLNQSQSKTSIPTNIDMPTTVPQSKLDVNRYIKGHIDEATDVLNNLSPDDIKELGGIHALVESTKRDIVDGLKKYGVDDIAENVKKIDTKAIDSIQSLKDEVAQAVSGVLDDLAKEAKKYKSAEEFVKAQGDYFHGTSNKIEGKLGDKTKGIWLAEDPNIANKYISGGESGAKGEVYYVKPTTKLKIKDIYQKGEFSSFNELTSELESKLIKEGYDGIRLNDAVRYENSFGNLDKQYHPSVRIFADSKNKLQSLTKSQLTDIYNQANKGSTNKGSILKNPLIAGAGILGAGVVGAKALDNQPGANAEIIEEQPKSKSVTLREQKVSPDEIEEAKHILFSEISNRPKDKQELEAKVILNTALNRMSEYAKRGKPKTLVEVLQMPNQYQGYTPASSTSQYALSKNKKLDSLGTKKRETLDNIIEKILTEGLEDNTSGAFYYIHKPDGKIVVDSKRKLFK